MPPSCIMAPHQNTSVEVHARHPVVLEPKLKSIEHLGDATKNEKAGDKIMYIYVHMKIIYKHNCITYSMLKILKVAQQEL